MKGLSSLGACLCSACFALCGTVEASSFLPPFLLEEQDVVETNNDTETTKKDCCHRRGPRGHKGKRGEKGHHGATGATGATGVVAPSFGGAYVIIGQESQPISDPTNYTAVQFTHFGPTIGGISNPTSNTFIITEPGTYNIAYSVQASTPRSIETGQRTIAYLSTYLEINPLPSFPQPIDSTHPGLALNYGISPIAESSGSLASTANQITVPITVPTTVRLMTLLQSNEDGTEFSPYFGALGGESTEGGIGTTEEQAVTLIITKVD
jgi:hypothetical protein